MRVTHFLSVVIVLGTATIAQAERPPHWLRLISEECEACEPRMTLMLWNSAVEPDGGPPPMDEPLASDRPDFTEASSTVGRGVVQIETGYTYFHDNDGVTTFRGHSFPETLFRVGVLAEWLELRAAWNYGIEETSNADFSNRLRGAEDLYLGLKLGLTPQQGIFPEMALVPQMRIPTGARVFSDNEVLPGVNWLYGWDVCEFLSTAGSTQVNIAVDAETDDEYLEFAQSWTIGYTLSEKLGAYTEWFVLAPCGAESMPTEHYVDGGFTYRVTNNLQLDIRAGKGLSDNAVDYFTGAGAVVRF